jgi:hypothetical protein
MYEAIIFIAGVIAGIALIIALTTMRANEFLGPESGRDPEHTAKSSDIQEKKSRWTWNPSTFGRKG